MYRSYVEVNRRTHGYMLLDLSQDTDDRHRLRNRIFPSKYPPTIYTNIDDETDKVELSCCLSTQGNLTETAKCHHVEL